MQIEEKTAPGFLPRAVSTAIENCDYTAALDEFRAAIATRGITPPDAIIADGKLHRCDAAGRRGKGDAAYLLHLDSLPAGGFQNWRDGLGWEDWRADTGRNLTADEQAAYRAKIAAARAEREIDEACRHAEAREVCAHTWNAAQPCDLANPHPYLARKGVASHGLKVTGNGRLLIPMRDENGMLHSLQFIDADGIKRYKTNGRKRGCYFAIGSPADGVLCIAEGYATAASIFEATGYAVAVAFDAGNLRAVAEALRAKLPDVRIVLCADDDHETPGNPGLTKAQEAARAVGGLVAVPSFGECRALGMTDFNDLAAAHGPDAVARCIDAAQPPGEACPAMAGGDDGGSTEASAPRNPETDEERITRLASLSPVEYDRVRTQEAKAMRIRAAVLDKAVQEQRGERQTNGDFDDVEPWPDSVDGGALLSDITATIQRFIVCEPVTAHAAALWVAMSWLMDAVQVAPLAVITAPEMRCGKSQLLTILGRLSHRPMVASNITPAALFRVIDAWQPSLMIDEADAFMRENEELRGIINSGHTRDSAYVIRVVGDDHTPKQFSTWGAKAIAGIGHLAGTLMDRAIILELRRKLPHENVERLRDAEPELFESLASRLARFALDNGGAVQRARPELPSALNDRAQDNWEPLLAIADAAGGPWPELARRAALEIACAANEGETIGTELLSDIREIFDTKRIERISTSELIEALCDDEERPWSTFNRGNPIKPRQIANRLKGYGVTSKNVRIGYAQSKGYERSQFLDAWERYIPLSTHPDLSVPPSQIPGNPHGCAVFGGTDKEFATVAKNQPVPSNPSNGADFEDWDGGTDKNGGSGTHTFLDIQSLPGEKVTRLSNGKIEVEL